MKIGFLVILFSILSVAGFTHGAQASPEVQEQTHNEKKTGGRFAISGDMGGRVNPNGFAVFGGLNYRYVYRYNEQYHAAASYLQTGVGVGVSPAAMQAGVHVEFLPWIFLPLRVQYDCYQYFGASGGLLSFASPNADYGDKVRSGRSDEERAHAHRLLFQPTLQGKMDRFILRNQTDFAYYMFSGRGPYFLELTYDTLLKDGDYLISNRTYLLYSVLEGHKNKTLLAGPYYEVTRAFDARITQQKLGVSAYWEPAAIFWHLQKPYLGLTSGYHLQDPNRRGQFYLMLATGFQFSF